MSLHRSLVLLLLAWVSATAQQPTQPQAPPPAVPAPVTPTPPGVPVPGVPNLPAGAPNLRPAAAAAAAVPKPGIPLGENKIVEDIVEPKLSGDALAGLYRKYTGRRVIVTTAAATAEFRFVQEASPEDPLTYEQAAELLRKAAVLENFVFVPHPQDPKLDILTLATGGPRPTNVDVSVYNENRELPDTDIVITYVMTLDHIKPDQALNIFTQIIGQFGAYGSIAAVPNASAVVITEKASLIKSLIDLKKTIDVPGSVQSSKFLKVQYADVTEIATTLTELMTAQQSAQQTSGIQRSAPAPAQGAPAVNNAAGGSTSGGEDTPVQILPEPRTNRIFVMGRPVDIVFVEGLVREFDIPSDEKTFLRRKLRFLTVSEFLPIAGDALTRAFSGTGEGGAGGTTGGAGGQSNRSQSNSRSSSSSGFGNRSSSGSSRSGFSSSSGNSGFSNSGSGFGGSGSSGFGGGGSAGSALDAPNVSSAPESVLVGRTLLVADNITNSIVAQGPPSALEIIERLLDQLDVKPDQVMISTVIGQLSLGKTLDTGVSYLFKGQDILSGGGDVFPGFIPSTGTGTGTTSGNAFPSFDRSVLTGSGLRMFGTVGDMRIFLKALQNRTDFTVLSRPSIFTSNNQKGSISSGERIAIPTNSNSFSNGGASTNIEYQDVVLKLEVIPLVNSDDEITMQIALLNDEQNGTQTIAGAGSNGQDLTVPKISTREILTTVTVPNNNTIVLGGLIVGRNGKDKSGIPILSDIPYLGYLFGGIEDTNNRSELMVLMQPTIVKSNRSLEEVQYDMDNRYQVSSKVQNFADGDSNLAGVQKDTKVDKGGKGGGHASAPAENTSGTSTVKPTIRPLHRR